MGDTVVFFNWYTELRQIMVFVAIIASGAQKKYFVRIKFILLFLSEQQKKKWP